jgi:hypothetical protein
MSLISNKVAYFGILTMALIVGYKFSDIPKMLEYAKPLDCNISSFDSGLNKTIVDVNNQQCNLKVTIDQDYQSYPIGDAMIQVHIAQVIRHNNMVHEKEPFAHINDLKIHSNESNQISDELMGQYAHGVVELRLSSDPVVLTHELNHAIYYGSMKREFMEGRFYSQFTNTLGNKDSINSISEKNIANTLYGYSGFVDSKLNKYNEFWAYGSEYLHLPFSKLNPNTIKILAELKYYSDKNIKEGFYSSESITKYNLGIAETFDNLNTCGPELFYNNSTRCSQFAQSRLDSLNKLFTMLENANPDLGYQQPNYFTIFVATLYCLLEMSIYSIIAYIIYLLSTEKKKKIL